MPTRRKKSQAPKVSYYKKPPHLTTEQWQRELRKTFVEDKKQMFVINVITGEHPVF